MIDGESVQSLLNLCFALISASCFAFVEWSPAVVGLVASLFMLGYLLSV